MTGTVSLRPATPQDAPEIARVHVETWRTAYAGLVPDSYLLGLNQSVQAARWARSLGRNGGAESVLVAEAPGPKGQRIVGFGSCGGERGEAARGEVFMLYVQGDWQNHGIGRLLLTGLFEGLARRKMDAAIVWVLSGNPARFFYETLGGARAAERQEGFAGTTLDETAYLWPDLRAWLSKAGGRI